MVNEDKFVASEPGREIAVEQHGDQPLRRRLEQFVARRMAEQVVHFLEAVEIEAEDRQPGLAALGRDEAFIELVVEGDAVGKCRQRVVHGDLAYALLGQGAFAKLGDARRHIVQRQNVAAVRQFHAMHFRRAVADFEILGAALQGQPDELVKPAGVAAEGRFGEFGEARIPQREHALGVEHRHAGNRRLQHRVQQPLAAGMRHCIADRAVEHGSGDRGFGKEVRGSGFERGLVDEVARQSRQQDDRRIDARQPHVLDEVDTRDGAQPVIGDDAVIGVARQFRHRRQRRHRGSDVILCIGHFAQCIVDEVEILLVVVNYEQPNGHVGHHAYLVNSSA